MPPRKQGIKRIEQRQKEFVDDLPLDEFTGYFSLQWTGPESFQYQPDPDDPFRYIRNKSNGKTEIIQANSMSTSGGSIPVAAQLITGKTPWE